MYLRDKRAWLKRHGRLTMSPVDYGDPSYGSWDCLHLGLDACASSQKKVIDDLYNGAKDELFSRCEK